MRHLLSHSLTHSPNHSLTHSGACTYKRSHLLYTRGGAESLGWIERLPCCELASVAQGPPLPGFGNAPRGRVDACVPSSRCRCVCVCEVLRPSHAMLARRCPPALINANTQGHGLCGEVRVAMPCSPMGNQAMNATHIAKPPNLVATHWPRERTPDRKPGGQGCLHRHAAAPNKIGNSGLGHARHGKQRRVSQARSQGGSARS